MTIRMDEGEVIASLIGSGIFFLAIVLAIIWLLWMMVRPSRRSRRERRERRERPENRIDAVDAEEMLRLMARMEHRLEVLERALADQERRENRLGQAAEAADLRRNQ